MAQLSLTNSHSLTYQNSCRPNSYSYLVLNPVDRCATRQHVLPLRHLPCLPWHRQRVSGRHFQAQQPGHEGQLSKIVSNSARYSETHTERTFQDVPQGSAFYQFIERLATRGFISGYPCGGVGEPCVPPGNLPYFRPSANVTRGQSTKIVGNTFFPNCETPAER